MVSMRNAVFILATVQFALLLLFALGTGMSDPAGNAMSRAFVTLGGIVMGILLVPALILAINRKALHLALTLAIVSMMIAVIGLANV